MKILLLRIDARIVVSICVQDRLKTVPGLEMGIILDPGTLRILEKPHYFLNKIIGKNYQNRS